MKSKQSGTRAARSGEPMISRRAVWIGGGALALGAGPALAQSGNWMDGIFGFPGSRTSVTEKRERPVDVLNDLRPDTIPWRSDQMLDQMDQAIQRYTQVVQRGGWPAIPGNRMLRPGDDDERVSVLRRRLIVSGDLKPRGGGYDASLSFDDALEAAVRRFQERHGLRVTGRADAPTIAQLNISAHARLEQLKLNLRRIRDLMQSRVEDRYILVNAAAFQLEAVEGYEVRQRHRVIAGKPERQTPEVRAVIKALNFFPYWRVPDSVATLDLFPRLQKEPDYLQKEQIRVLSGAYNGPEIDPRNIDWRTAEATRIKFRQDPGPQNALGLLRIDMPNPEGVYMHDTPMKPLFNQRARAFSAGCVRVQDVFKLGEWIARYELGWDQPGRVQDVINSGQALDLNLTRPVPVYFAYITAWAEANGQVEFRPDIYGRDGSKDLAGERDPDAPPPPQTLAP
jgi:murein L,D-transpeptidase YcbB/YkuD